MNNLWMMEVLAQRKKKLKLSRQTLDDLILRLVLLKSAKVSISISRVIFRKLTITTFSDSSEIGTGGFCLQTGVGWHNLFTLEDQKAFTLNMKEYITSAIDMEVVQAGIDSNPPPFPCILNRSNCTSTVGWIRKSNHDP